MKTIKASLIFLIYSSIVLNFDLIAEESISEDSTLGAIRIVYENFRTVDRAFVLSHILLSEGSEFNRVLSDQSLRSLYDTNYFEFIDFRFSEVNAVPELSIHLTAKYKIRQFEFLGNQKFSVQRLMEAGELNDKFVLDEYQIDTAAKKMSELYAEKGYKDTKIAYSIERDAAKGDAAVFFEIEESPKTSVKYIAFDGLKAYSEKQLMRLMKTKKKNIFSLITGSGNFDQLLFDKDLERLRMYYQNKGFLDIKIDPEAVEYNFSDPENSAIRITIDEGEQYVLGSVEIVGASIFTEEELFKIIEIDKFNDSYYAPQVIQNWIGIIEDFYSSRGYLETRVLADRKSNLENRQIDIVFNIKESQKFYLESISIEGNTKTQQKVIVRELALKPGDVFDYKRMQASEKRLKNTAFFDNVRLRPEPTDIPGRKNLNVLVSESQTGSFSFGAGFGSVRSSQFFLEMKQSNFDINDWRSGFQGAGQKFRARLSFGQKSSQALIGFEEPWLFQQRLSFGSNLYSTEAEYNSTQYDEKRTGIELYIRRRLVELLEAKFSYQHELVDIYNVIVPGNINTPDSIADVFQEQESFGEQKISKVGISLLRDNRDSFIFTRSGNRTSLDTEFCGFGGDVNYFKTDIRTAQFIPTLDLWKQSFSIIARLGLIIPLEGDDVPFYDRFYLGGPETLRGFDFRDIGPRAKDGTVDGTENGEDNFIEDTIGGNTYGLISTEYSFQLSDGFGLVAFYDGGFVNALEKDFDLGGYADNIGIGARLIMMGSPLKLDFAFPLNRPNHLPNSSQFHFSFGTRY